MLSLTNRWQCDIWPRRVRLRRNHCVIATHERDAGTTLEASLDALLALRPAALPWRDTLEFHLDTDDLVFLIQPWQSGVSTPQEFLRLAQQQSAMTFRQSDPWRVAFEAAAWQQSALVACLKQSCWQQLSALAHRHRLRFRGVATPFQPLLKHYANRLPENGLFVAIGPEHSRIATRQHNSWSNVWTLPLPQQEMDDQLRIITRLSGMVNCRRYVIDSSGRQPTELPPLEESA